MKNILVLIALSLFATFAKGSEVFVYGALQASRQYVEVAKANNEPEVKYERDLKDQPYGLGAEYRFEDDGDFFLGAGALYQTEVKIEQSDLQHMSFTHLYFNAYSRVNKGLNFFIGTQYSIPEWRSHRTLDNYRMRNNLGFRLGLDLELPKSFGAQLYYRNVFLETKDSNGYEGKINISSLMATIGYRF